MSELEDLKTSVDGLREDVQEMATNVAALSATTTAHTERAREEIKVLFARGREHGDRIGSIERSYVPREEHVKAVDENRGDHKDFREGLDQHGTFGGKVWGGAIVVGVIGSAVLAWWLTQIG